MHRTPPAYRAPRDTVSPVFAGAILLVAASVVGVLVPWALSPSATETEEAVATELAAEPAAVIPMTETPVLDIGVSTDDGRLPDGTTILDASHAGIAKLDGELVDALGAATGDAAADGIALHVNSGWRSAEYQESLLREAIAEHGSRENAMRWVATATTSPHVSGDAVDIGPAEAAAWLSERGAAYGLCQIYANEPWHFELRPDAARRGCPPMYADPTQDPRMQR